MLKNWIRIFIYNIKQNKLFTLLNTLGLSIGIAGIIFAILYWNDETSYNKWNPEVDNVYQVISNIRGSSKWATSIAPLEPYLKEISEIDNYSYTYGWYSREIAIYKEQKKFFKKTCFVQKDFFKLFPFTFLKGNPDTALDDKLSILLSKKTVDFLFKDEDPMGKSVKYGNHNYTVTGVYEVQGKSSINPEIITTRYITNRLEKDKDSWGNFNYSLLLQIKNKNNVEKVIEKINDVYFKNKSEKDAKSEGISIEDYEKKYGKITVSLFPLKDARLKAENKYGYPEGRGNYQFLLIMVGLSTLILILSIVNYINLATAGAIKRAKEVGIRKVVGASKLNIVYQFVFETFVTTLFAIIAALSIVELTLPYYNNLLDKDLTLLNNQFYLQLIIILLVVILFAGIFPAFYIANFKALKVLKGNFDRSKSGVWLRNGMLVLQFTIASFFIIGSYIVYKQVSYLTNKDLGFSSEQVIEITYHKKGNPTEIIQSYETVKNELLKIKGVNNVVATAFRMGGGGSSSSSFTYNDETVQGQNMAYDYGMLDMFKIKMKEGRTLQAKFASDSIKNILINETAQRMMKEKKPIGKEFKWNGKKLKIVGVVKDFDLTGPQNETLPMVFFHLKTIDWMAYNVNCLYVKISPDNIQETINNIETFWKDKVDQKYPFEYIFVDKAFAKTYKQYVNQKNLFSVLNVIVILIALFGLFALASFSIQRKMKSIAIRKTLGAETKTLLIQLSKQYIVFCLVGFVLAVYPVLYFLNKWLSEFDYRIDISVLPFIVGFAVLLILTLIIVIVKAYQATKVDVLTYLKYE